MFPSSLLLHLGGGRVVRLDGHSGGKPDVSRAQRRVLFGLLGGVESFRIQQLQYLWFSPRLQDETVHFLSDFCVILMNESEEDLSLFSKPVVYSVLNVTGSPWKISQGMRFQLSQDPLDCLLPVFRSDVGVDALISQIVDVWPQEGFRFENMIERRRNLPQSVLVQTLVVQSVQSGLRENKVGPPLDQQREMIQIHWELGLNGHLLIAFIALGPEGEEAPAGVLIIDELDAHRLPDTRFSREALQTGLVDDQLDVDIVQAGEDDVAVVSVVVHRPEGISVLQLSLKVPEAGDIDGLGLWGRRRGGGYVRRGCPGEAWQLGGPAGRGRGEQLSASLQ